MKLRIAGRFAFFAVLAALLVALPAASQFLEKGSITGTVYDPSGAVVPGATVRIIHVTSSRSACSRVRTNSSKEKPRPCRRASARCCKPRNGR